MTEARSWTMCMLALIAMPLGVLATLADDLHTSAGQPDEIGTRFTRMGPACGN